MEDVDDIIFANYPASDTELEKVSSAHRYQPTLYIELEEGVSEVEKKILFNRSQFVRGDISQITLRAMTGLFYAKEDISTRNIRSIEKGDVLIDNNEYG